MCEIVGLHVWESSEKALVIWTVCETLALGRYVFAMGASDLFGWTASCCLEYHVICYNVESW
jgi:hypothetical protein